MSRAQTETCSDELYAHTPNASGKWHLLAQHISEVANMAASFAAPYGVADLAGLAGALHDLGKARSEFQAYLRKCHHASVNGLPAPARSVRHSIHGAAQAASIGQHLLAIALAGHHGGIPNLSDLRSKLPQTSIADVAKDAYAYAGRFGSPAPPEWASSPLSCEFLIRMLFSALVDADWLDTERHFEPQTSTLRGKPVRMEELWAMFQADQTRLIAGAKNSSGVNAVRHEIYEACVRAADGPQGVYRLTVPTGGGKTRSGMAFALRHALKHDLKHIIFAIPYTSIIDQTAAVYEGIFGERNVLEHHSSIAPPTTDEESEAETRRLLASENWDAPVVVTTTVQLFESLFANKPSRCRKLHSIARSVIVLDEVQTLPTELTAPIVDVLKELCAHYGVTLVLSTATQPAFSGESPYLRGFDPAPIEIVPEPKRYFDLLKRVEYEVIHDPWSWERVAEEMRSEDQALCVVNSRKDALTLYSALDDPDALHLSTLMYPAHRREVLVEIRRRLETGEPCRVVSTQVIEAGVDVDFPFVLRAMGPLDRIVQAAGRCNREGRMGRPGRVVVFIPEDGRTPKGTYRLQMDIASGLLEQGCDLGDPDIMVNYFARLYGTTGRAGLDRHGISRLRFDGEFQQVATQFRMIEQNTTPVVIRRDPCVTSVIAKLSSSGVMSRKDFQVLQQYSVNLFDTQYSKYCSDGSIHEITLGIGIWCMSYDDHTGLSDEVIDPMDLVISP